MNSLSLLLLTGAVALPAAEEPSTLPTVRVVSPLVANQAPAGSFAMPVSALRFEPRVDLQARNLVEGQADVTARGGTFESIGLQLGAIPVMDPQTGHYLTELPVAPAMLGAPQLRTGAALAGGAGNAGVGVIGYGWREIQDAGSATVGGGAFNLRRAEAYQGLVRPLPGDSRTWIGLDLSLAHSESDGAVPWGEHEFDRVAGRLQLRTERGRTDAFAGYQAKRFGWPNLYTPFNSNETERLQTTLLVLNHRQFAADGQGFEAGAFFRRNKDDYAFNRFALVGAVHPYQHTTWTRGAAADGQVDLGGLRWTARAEARRENLRSTSLIFGRFNDRLLTRFSLVPERTWAKEAGGRNRLAAGVVRDDSDREAGAWLPVVQWTRDFGQGTWRRIHLSYAGSSQLPSFTALNSSATAGLFRGNPNLGRSISRNLEAGAEADVQGWNLAAAAFWRRDAALVDWTFRRGVTARSANAVDVGVAGAEVVARRSWGRGDVVLGYTGLAKDADYRGAAVDASFYALNHARHRVTAAVVMRLGAGWEARWDNAARVQADNPLRTAGGSRALISSAGLAWRPRALRGFELSLQADNLWDDRFHEVPGVPAGGRLWSIGLTQAW
jgi:hypothetical protein